MLAIELPTLASIPIRAPPQPCQSDHGGCRVALFLASMFVIVVAAGDGLWTARWLNEIGLAQYAELFRANDIDANVLRDRPTESPRCPMRMHCPGWQGDGERARGCTTRRPSCAWCMRANNVGRLTAPTRVHSPRRHPGFMRWD
jgi:hypothetical protein